MRVPLYQVNAFTTQRFRGNPAAVMVLDRFPDDDLLQAIAAENNVAETAFVVPDHGEYQLRWFTPLLEVPLCGHATLASGAVVLERLEPGRRQVVFHSKSGPLTVTRTNLQTGARYVMDLPAHHIGPVAEPVGLTAALGASPLEVLTYASSYLAVLDSAARVRDLTPDLAAISRLDRSGVAVTAAGDAGYDLVSRYFAPQKGIPEDPVTGGAHCAAVPYWARQLGKTDLRAYQASRRGGELLCRLRDDRVELGGGCVFYLEGNAEI